MIVLVLLGAWAAGWATGRWWSPRAAGSPLSSLILGVALAGVVVAVAVPTLLLALAGTLFPPPLRSADDPALLAMVVGMQATQLSVVAYAAAQRAPLGLVRPAARWLAWAVVLAFTALLSSAGWGMLLGLFEKPAEDQAILALFREAPWTTRLAIGVAVGGVAPVLEELVFRGYAQPLLMRRFGAMIGSAVTAVGFASLHLDAPQVLPPILVLAVGLGELRRRSGSVWPGMLAHALNNSIALTMSM